MSVNVDLIDVGRYDDPDEGVVWSGRLPHVPAVDSVLDIGLGHGPRYVVAGRAPRWNLKDHARGGANRDHEVASVIVWVMPALPREGGAR